MLSDGTVAGVALVEALYDTGSGERVGTRTVDPVTGAAYTATGTLQPCSTSSDCESPTTPLTSVGLCLADGTPIAVTVIRDCSGAVTSEGWINLSTGAWSTGAPPAGTVGACQPTPQPDREVVCYRSPTAFGACTNVQITDLPQPKFASASVVANPQNWPVNQANLASTINGNVSGAGGPNAPEGVINCDAFQGDTGVVIDYLLAAPRDNVTAVRLWNCFGSVVTDNDGIGSATVTLYDEAGAVLFTGPLVACQYVTSSAYATPCVTPVGNLDGVARMRLENLAKFPPSVGTVAPDVGWREIDLFSTYEATLTVDCGGAPVSALVEGKQPGLTYADGKLTQVNGPHTLTFTVPGGGTGRIITDNPAAFSALDFADGSVITVTGDGAVDFATEIVSGAATKSGYVTWDPVNGEPTVRDANSGETIADAEVVPCASTCCTGSSPDGVTQPEQDVIQLCDTATDGTVTSFVRDYARDESGAIVGHSDYDLDGTAYTPAGTVGICGGDCCEPVQVCVQATATETIEFISNEAQVDDDSIDTVWTWTNDGDASGPAAAATWYQMYRARYGFNPAAWSVVDSAPTRKAGWISPHPNGATTSTGAPGEGPTLSGTPANPMRWWAKAAFSLPAAADPDSIRVQITVLNADQIASRFRLNSGAWTALPGSATYNGTPYTFGPGIVAGAQPGTNTLIFEVLETVDDNPGNGAGVMAHFIVTYDVPGLGQRSWTRMMCCDGSIYYIDEFGERRDELPLSSAVVPCGSAAEPLTLCDDNGAFLRHVSYVGDQVLTMDTDLNGSAYEATGRVGNCATDGSSARGPVDTGIRSVTGTTVEDLTAEFPDLQSVSLAVLADTVDVTMSDGTSVPIPAGVTLTWSVSKDTDSALAAASFAGADSSASYLLNWTYLS
ncbi:hypothetical protein ACFYOF_20810 [Streptomyces sp. NPDC007148]|uniref:hypothetical protein n=1 Tax=Streptomyces sp. NPDC007148 TaxID=3364775 RepID=UPI00369E2329